MTPTPQQQDIFDAVLNGTRHVIVDASAGSGKSTTLVMLAKFFSPERLSVFLAFNKDIAEALKERLPYFCQARTFHSYCYGALRLHMKQFPKVDVDKVRKIFLSVVEDDKDEFFLYFPFVKKLVSLAKGQATQSPDWYTLIDRHEIDCEGDESTGVDYCREVFSRSQSDLINIDLDDQLYLAWLTNVPFQRVDYLCADEVQDFNAIQRALLPRMLKPTGKLIAVGDPNQAIYGFRGASHDSMAQLKSQFDCLELPLSVSYRCSKAVVAAARNILNNNHQ